MVFNFLLTIDLYLWIRAVSAQIFKATVELPICTETPTIEANSEIETQPLTSELKIRKCSK